MLSLLDYLCLDVFIVLDVLDVSTTGSACKGLSVSTCGSCSGLIFLTSIWHALQPGVITSSLTVDDDICCYNQTTDDISIFPPSVHSDLFVCLLVCLLPACLPAHQTCLSSEHVLSSFDCPCLIKGNVSCLSSHGSCIDWYLPWVLIKWLKVGREVVWWNAYDFGELNGFGAWLNELYR